MLGYYWPHFAVMSSISKLLVTINIYIMTDSVVTSSYWVACYSSMFGAHSGASLFDNSHNKAHKCIFTFDEAEYMNVFTNLRASLGKLLSWSLNRQHG